MCTNGLTCVQIDSLPYTLTLIWRTRQKIKPTEDQHLLNSLGRL